jgi:glycine/D-amino acid oxidase-like deaminating enzyme
MNLQPESHGLWATTAPPPPETSALAEEVRTDVAIIGGGFTGLSAALHLAEAGIAATVVEANEFGFGGSGRNAGLVNPGFWLPLPDIIKALGEEAGERMIDDLSKAPSVVFNLIKKHGITCEAVRNGNLHMAHSARGFADLAGRCEEWARRGAPVEMYDRSTTIDKTGTTAYQGAMLDRRAGTIQPLAYVRGLADAALNAGANLFTQSPAQSIIQENGHWIIKTPDGTLIAEKLLISTGGYGQDAQQARHQTVPYFYFQCATRPLSHNILAEILPEKHGTWDTHTVLRSFRLDADGRLIFGSIGKLDSGGGLHKEWAVRGLKAIYPQIAEDAWEEAWYGRIAMTHDHLPRLVEVGINGLAIYGYNGRGIGPGTVFGRAIAKYFETGEETALPFPLTPNPNEPFAGLRGLAIEAGARAFHLMDGRI